MTVSDWLEEFTFANPQWDDKLGHGREEHAPALLREIRDSGDFNMFSSEVTWIVASAFSITFDRASQICAAWMINPED